MTGDATGGAGSTRATESPRRTARAAEDGQSAGAAESGERAPAGEAGAAVATSDDRADDKADDTERRRRLPWRRSGKRSFWRELPVLALIAVLVAVLIRTFVMQTFFIPSGSMESTLLVDDRVLVNKVVYDLREPHRGEIVVFQPPPSWRIDPTEEDFIKRVVGLPGDTVACVRDSEQQGSDVQAFVGKVAVNGRAVDEEYINPDSPACNQAFEVEVPAGRLFVLGDHRRASGDSRVHLADPDSPNGTIAISDVVGRAEAIYWPVNRWRFLGTPETFDNVPEPDDG